MGVHQITIDGWRIEAAGRWLINQPHLFEAAASQAVRTIEGAGGCLYHRSRHAMTYLTQFSGADSNPLEVYIKAYNAPGRAMALKEMMRGGRAGNVMRMTAALQRAGFATPALLLTGVHLASKRTMVAAARADGVPLPEVISEWQSDASPARKRRLLSALGSEVARLHRAGFIHGDLTPFNIFVVPGEAPRFIFLDHDRTRPAFPAGRRYRQLRNLVQLGRFDLAGISHTDRLRVFWAYAAGMELVGSRSIARRVASMLSRRRRRDSK
jgi:tRNA A-37 threonylcarbamoyl transferase component Bud32